MNEKFKGFGRYLIQVMDRYWSTQPCIHPSNFGKIHEGIASDIIEEIISEAHKHEGTYFNLTTMWQYILRTPYWWPTRRKDVLAYCQECPICKVVSKGEMHDTFSPPHTEDHDDLLPLEPLKAGKDLTGGPDPDWTTPCVQYLTHGTKWETDLPEEEKQLIAYCS